MRGVWDFTPLVDELIELVREHDLGDGFFSRTSARTDASAAGIADAYGTSNAVNILYTVDALPSDPAWRERRVEALRSFQDAETGEFRDSSHGRTHTTAHLSGALELLDARPAHPLRFLDALRDPAAVGPFLDGIDWSDPWAGSHEGAGSAAALTLTDAVAPGWIDAYIGWLDDHVDPTSGLWLRDRMLPVEDSPGFFANLGGAFHYHFLYAHFGRPLPAASAVVDSCLEILRASPVGIATETVGFVEIDWAYSIHRAARQSGHRSAEVRDALAEVASRVADILLDPATWRTAGFDDLHSTCGAISAVAELQSALPERVRTPRPLRLVLDRRPFI